MSDELCPHEMDPDQCWICDETRAFSGIDALRARVETAEQRVAEMHAQMLEDKLAIVSLAVDLAEAERERDEARAKMRAMKFERENLELQLAALNEMYALLEASNEELGRVRAQTEKTLNMEIRDHRATRKRLRELERKP
jgi:chromosome segregation ATPase